MATENFSRKSDVLALGRLDPDPPGFTQRMLDDDKMVMKRVLNYASKGKFLKALSLLKENEADPMEVEALGVRATTKKHLDAAFWNEAKSYIMGRRAWRSLVAIGGNAAEIGVNSPDLYMDIVKSLAEEKKSLETTTNFLADVARDGLLRLGFTDFILFKTAFECSLPFVGQRDSDFESLIDMFGLMLMSEQGYPLFSPDAQETAIKEVEGKIKGQRVSDCDNCVKELSGLRSRIRSARQAEVICEKLYDLITRTDRKEKSRMLERVQRVYELGFRAARAGMLTPVHASIMEFIEEKYTPAMEREAKTTKLLPPKRKLITKLRCVIKSNCSVSECNDLPEKQ